MADLINITSNNPDFVYITKTDTYGGMQFNVGLNPNIVDTLRWVQDYKAKLDREARARAENESVAAAYEQYQTVLNLVLDQI